MVEASAGGRLALMVGLRLPEDNVRSGDGHRIWTPGSSPRRLHPDIENAIIEP